MQRREFLKAAVGSAAAMAGAHLMTNSTSIGQSTSSTNAAVLPRREFKKGIELSIIGMGGIVVMDETQEHANDAVGLPSRPASLRP